MILLTENDMAWRCDVDMMWRYDVAMLVYKSMIIPYFDYADVIYSTANQDGLDKLQRLLNRCPKICKGLDRRFNTEELHAITKIPKLDARRKCHIHNFMYNKLSKPHLLDNRARGGDSGPSWTGCVNTVF